MDGMTAFLMAPYMVGLAGGYEGEVANMVSSAIFGTVIGTLGGIAIFALCVMCAHAKDIYQGRGQ